MDTVVVVDTVVVLMTEASKTWFAINAYWLIPAITLFVTISGIITSAWISAINTKKQIENSRISTEKQIQASQKNTYIQIENQNKQLYRPYIISENKGLRGFKKQQLDSFEGYDTHLEGDFSGGELKYLALNFNLRNIGVGLARNLNLIGVNKTTVGINHAKNKNYRLPDVKVDGTYKFEVVIDYYVTGTPSVYNLMLFYTDINNNVYSVLIQSTIINSSEQSRTWYFSDTSHFNKKMDELGIKYRDLVLSYEQEYLM